MTDINHQMIYRVKVEESIIRADYGVIFGLSIVFRAPSTSATFQMVRRLCKFGGRACIQLSWEHIFTIKFFVTTTSLIEVTCRFMRNRLWLSV